MMILLQLFVSFLKIGLFSFGGGYAMLPLIQDEIVRLHGWVTQANFVDIIAIAQITPGPIAVNSATFVGYHVAGVPGAVIATFAVVSGPLVLAAIVVRLADRFSSSYLVQGALTGLRPALLALIAYSAISIARTSFTGVVTVLVGVGAFALLIFTRVHPLIILGATALIGGLFLGG
ncbi:MAG TPA: chromate transporter [Spirochaetia bacterium]|nr:chromate transporter [Spirochaetia bacterium]